MDAVRTGRIETVWFERHGSTVAADAPSGTQVISVAFTGDFDELGGQLQHVQTGSLYDYTAADPNAETVTLAAPLPSGESFAVGDALRVYPLSDDLYAHVRLDDAASDEEPITARVSQPIRAMLLEGIRDPGAGEAVRVENTGFEWVVRDVVGFGPEIDGRYIGLMVLSAARIFAPTDDPTQWHLEIGDPNKPIVWRRDINEGFSLSHDPVTDKASVYVSGRVDFGAGSSVDSDYLELHEQPAGFLTPGLRQSRFESRGGTLDGLLGIAWPSTTVKGSLLLAYIHVSAEFGTTPPTVAAPAGWAQVATVTRGQQRLSLFCIQDAASRSGTEEFDFDISAYQCGALFEYTGMAAVALDQFATAHGSSTTISSGTTATTTQADELVFAVGGYGGEPVAFSDPSGSLSHLGSATGSATGSPSVVMNKAAAMNATALVAGSTTWDIGALREWVGITATFKTKMGAGNPGVPEANRARIFTRDLSGAAVPHVINDAGRIWSLDTPKVSQLTLPGNAAAPAGEAWGNWGSAIIFPDPDMSVIVLGWASGNGFNESAGPTGDQYMAVRVRISLDGGATWTAGQGPRDQCSVPNSAWGMSAATHSRIGTPNGEIRVQAQIQTSNPAAVRFHNGSIAALIVPAG
ncbi:hypothetical protein BAY59_10720 [Prauserella coralliicola]|nr:hypothetical protein BAY59_10720 [Prauserella coralliicola]